MVLYNWLRFRLSCIPKPSTITSSMDRTWTIVGVVGSPRVPYSPIIYSNIDKSTEELSYSLVPWLGFIHQLFGKYPYIIQIV